MHEPKNGNEGEILIEIIIALLCKSAAPSPGGFLLPGLLPAGGTHEIFNLYSPFYFTLFVLL